MILNELVQKVRRYTRDTTGSLFVQQDIVDFINEGLDRTKQVVKHFKNASYLRSNSDEVELIPEQYQHLLSVYSASRCFAQDEQQYQATTYMNEFEAKLNELLQAILSGDIVITDKDGNVVDSDGNLGLDYVVDIYFAKNGGDTDVAE